MYWWLKYLYHQHDRTNMMAFKFPINHDSMPIPGYPTKYKIVGGWSIPKRDLKFLIKGPLAKISPPGVLVSHQIGYQRVKSFAKAWSPMFVLIGSMLTILLRVLQLSGKIG